MKWYELATQEQLFHQHDSSQMILERTLQIYRYQISNLTFSFLGRLHALILSRLVGRGAESARAEFKYRYLNNGYSYDSKISRLFVEIHC